MNEHESLIAIHLLKSRVLVRGNIVDTPDGPLVTGWVMVLPSWKRRLARLPWFEAVGWRVGFTLADHRIGGYSLAELREMSE